MKLRLLEKIKQWVDLAERYIGLLKSSVLKKMHNCNIPFLVWYYRVEWRVLIHNGSTKASFNLDRKTPHMVTTGDTDDISNLCRF